MRSITRIASLLCLCMAMFVFYACAFVPASQQAVIDAQAGNALAYNGKVQATTQPDAATWKAVQTWTQAESDSWQSMSAWAHGKASATPATQP